MMRWLIAAVSLSALLLAMSCSTSYEAKGDHAYRTALKKSGDTKRLLEKEAYIYYRKAVKAHPDRISRTLRNRFAEMTLSRANLVLSEATSEMDALPLFIEDLDSILSADLDPRFKDQYSQFLILCADSAVANQKLFQAIQLVKKAESVAADGSSAARKLEELTGNLAKENFEIAEMEYQQYKTEKLTESLIRAEFRVKMALYYNSDFPGAKELLSTIYKENKGNYSAYESVVEDKPDTAIYRQVNKYTILLAVPVITRSGSGVTCVVSMYNYSFNPLRLMAGDFRLEDDNGNKYPANASSDLKKEILDQEMEVKMTLRFSGVSGTIKKLVYECCEGEQYTEKVFE